MVNAFRRAARALRVRQGATVGHRVGMRTVGVGVAALTVLGTAACTSTATPAKTAATTLSASPLPTWTPTPTPSPTVKLPTTAQLAAGLLTASDLGPGYTKSTDSTGTGTVTGCTDLANMINATTTTPQATVSYQASSTGPFVGDTLTTDKSATLDSEYAKAKAAINSCPSLTFTSGGTALKMMLTPINFGAGAAAARMDGTIQGVQVNGYLVLGRVPQAILGYYLLQIGDGSSQTAYVQYQQAAAKAQRVLGGQ